MPTPERHPRPVQTAGRYALTVAMVLASFALKEVFPVTFGPPYILFYPVVVAAAFFGGRGPGLVASGLAAALEWWVILPLVFPGPGLPLEGWVGFLIFTVTGAGTAVVVDLSHRSVAALAELEKQLAVERLQAQLAQTESSLAQSRQAAHWSAAQLQAVLDALGDGVVVLDASGTAVMVNAAEASICGYGAPGEMLRDTAFFASVFRLWRLDGRPLALADWPVSRVMRGERVVDEELSALRVDTGQRWHFSFSGGPVRDEAGQQVFSVIVTRDRTVQRQAEQALAASEARFRSWAENAPHAILVLDAEDRVVDANGLSAGLFGVPASALAPGAGATLASLLGPAVARAAHEAQDAGRTFEAATAVQRPDGSTVELELSVVPTSDERSLAFCQDVTQRVQLEERYRQAQKLESVGRLAGGVAHDFNNLLTVILGCAESARDALEHGQAPSREEVDDILSAGERARALTRQLLTFARRQPVAPRVVDVGAVVLGTQNLLRRVIGEDLALELSLAPEPGHVLFDPGQLEQVLMNLVVNARDAMPRGGRLVLSTRAQTVAAAEAPPGVEPGEWVVLRVRDSGTGMTPEVRAHLFEPFFTTKGLGQGTGLGLATVYGLVTGAGGALHVDSAPGVGTTFDIYLPRVAPPPPSAQVTGALSPRGGLELILVVEDDPLLRAVTTRMLTGAGYRVLVAAHAEEALRLAHREPNDLVQLVVSDVVMPGGDGPSLVRTLRATFPELPALLVSGYTHDVLTQHDVEGGGFAFLPKPFSGAALLERVRSLLDARAQVPRG